MLRFLTILVLTLGLALGTPAGAQTGNPAHDQIASRSAAEQRGALLALVRQTGQACNDVINGYFAGFDAARTAYWDGRCRDGNMYRTALPATRWGQPSSALCGAALPPPAGGPCFQSVQVAAATTLTPAQAAEQRCNASCAAATGENQAACVRQCLVGGGVAVGTQLATTLPANSRFGVIFATDQPLGAFGFANGNTDRLAVNLAAARACQAMAGRTPCKFQLELVNSCGALAQAYSRHPSAIAITSDLSTFVVNDWSTGTGANKAAAEAAAMAACRPSESASTRCRIVASGC